MPAAVVPPPRMARSRTRVFRPASAHSAAQAAPTMPAPTMMMLNGWLTAGSSVFGRLEKPHPEDASGPGLIALNSDGEFLLAAGQRGRQRIGLVKESSGMGG